MKRTFLTMIIIQLFTAIPLFADAPKWVNFNLGMERVKKEQKPMMLMVYANWCNICKKMDKNTLSDKKIIHFLDTNYLPVKINSDEQENEIYYDNKKYMVGEFLSAIGIRGVPTFVFFDKTGKVIGTLPGYFPADVFYNILIYIKDSCYLKNISLEKFVGNPKKCVAQSK